MKIGVAQIQACKGNIEINIKKHLQMIDAAIENQMDMIVFPELSLTGYEPELAKDLASTPDDKRLDVFQELSNSNQLVIGLGLPIREADNIHVGMVIFQPKQDRTVYCKQHLYHTEPPFFSSKKNDLMLNFKNGTKVSPAICYELSVAEHSECAHRNGANVYIASVLNSVGGVEGDLAKLSAIAAKYGMVTLMANYVGQSGGYECAGRSSVWDARGILVGQLDSEREGLMFINTETLAVFKYYI